MPQGKKVCKAADPGGDLWGRPPRFAGRCPGCDAKAEPYHGRFCWKCWATGQAAFVLAGPSVTQQEARPAAAGPTHGEG